MAAIVIPGNLGPDHDIGVLVPNKISIVPASTTVAGKVRLAGATDLLAGTAGAAVDAAGLAKQGIVRSLEYFGCVADWNGTTGTDNTAELNAALASGCRLYAARPGAYFVASTLAAMTNTHVSLQGFGKQASQIVFGTACTAGIAVSNHDYTTDFVLKDFGFVTLGQELGTAINVTYADAGSAYFGRVVLDNIFVGGSNIFAQGWANGIALSGGMWFTIKDILVVGRVDANATTAANYTHMTTALSLGGGATGIGGGYGRGLRLYCGQNGITSSASSSIEGINLAQVDCVSFNVGVSLNPGAASAGFVLNAAHLNVFQTGVYANNSLQALLSNLLIYKHPQTSASQETVGVWLVNSNECQGTNITLIRQTSATNFVGLRLDTSSYNTFAFSLDSGSNAVNIINSSAENDVTVKLPGSPSGTNLVVDTSGQPNNVRRRTYPLAVSNSSAVTTTSGGAYAVSQSVNMVAGESRIVRINIAHTAGATSGDVLYTLLSAGGSGAFTVNAAGSSGVIRFPAASSASTITAATFVVTCTTSGSIILAVLAQAIGSNGSIAAGGAQMTIRES